MRENKIIFLDRDGVINQKAPEGDYIKAWKEIELLPRVPKAIRTLNENGWLVIVITNQRGIARGMVSIEDVHDIHQKLNDELKKTKAHIDGFYICPHEKGSCRCRKPDIGLFLQAEQRFAVDKKQSWMIGDSESDIQAGRRYGIKTIAIGNYLFGADFCFSDLYKAVCFIVNL